MPVKTAGELRVCCCGCNRTFRVNRMGPEKRYFNGACRERVSERRKRAPVQLKLTDYLQGARIDQPGGDS
jgi:hypothetical protein